MLPQLTPHVSLISAILSSIILLYVPLATRTFVPSDPVAKPITRLAGTIDLTPAAEIRKQTVNGAVIALLILVIYLTNLMADGSPAVPGR